MCQLFRLFYPGDYKTMDYVSTRLKVKYSIDEIWVGMDRMSDAAKISVNWVKNDGNLVTEIPWADGYPKDETSKYCTAMNISNKGYNFLFLAYYYFENLCH